MPVASKLSQRDIFLKEEGDSWFIRCKDKVNSAWIGQYYVRQFAALGVKPKRILEIGCADGNKLDVLQDAFHVETHGIDPSSLAVQRGMERSSRHVLRVGTADSLPYQDDFFDCVIFGFCLYLCDRNLLFKIAAEADRVLSMPGYIIILDFYAPGAYRNTYTHKEGLFSYKMDYSSMFLWHPGYTLVSHAPLTHTDDAFSTCPDERLAVTTLAKEDYTEYAVTDPYRRS